MTIMRLFCTGYFILLLAIFANLIANYLNICTWYKFSQQIAQNGISNAIFQQDIISILWLFVIYPILLTLGHKIGEKVYFFIIH